MLEPWIIAEILRREQEAEEQQRPELRIEIEPPPAYEQPVAEEKEERGVCIIEL